MPNDITAPANLPATTSLGLVERALDRGVDISTMEKLIELQERTERNNARRAFDQAIAAAKAEFGKIGKSGSVSHGQGKTSFSHETMADISEAIDKPLSRYGLSYRFTTSQGQGGITVTCIIAHSEGHSEATSLIGAPDSSGAKNSIQAIGSTVTYLQRYTLKAALGLSASEIDDDGAAATAKPEADEDISLEQLQTIQDLIIMKGIPEDVILKAEKISSLSRLPKKRANIVMERLKLTPNMNQGAQK